MIIEKIKTITQLVAINWTIWSNGVLYKKLTMDLLIVIVCVNQWNRFVLSSSDSPSWSIWSIISSLVPLCIDHQSMIA